MLNSESGHSLANGCGILVVMDLEVELDVGLEVYPIDTVNDMTWVFR